MLITAEQLVTLTMNVRCRPRPLAPVTPQRRNPPPTMRARIHPLHTGRQLYDAGYIRDVLLSEHPDLTGVLPPPTYDQIIQLYLPPSWGRLQMRGQYHPERPQVRPLTDANLQPHAPGPRLERGSWRDEFSQTPPPDPVRQILADLDVLRGNPMAALAYVCCRAQNMSSADAMLWAHLTDNVWRLLQIAPATIRLEQSADAWRQGREGFAGARQSAARQGWSPDPEVRHTPLPLVPGVDAGRIRYALEQLEGQPAAAR